MSALGMRQRGLVYGQKKLHAIKDCMDFSAKIVLFVLIVSGKECSFEPLQKIGLDETLQIRVFKGKGGHVVKRF